MKTTVVVMTATLSALAFTGALQAHHSGYMYSTAPVRVEGTVVRFEPINPHTLTTVEGRSDDGQVRRWVVEGPSQSEIERTRTETRIPDVGDSIQFCAFPYRSAEELARLFPEADFLSRGFLAGADGSSPQFVVGHVMQSGDGNKQLWEPHGIISECIRNSDEDRQVWLNFINSSVRAREVWCQQKAYAHVRQTAELAGLVDQVDRSIANPCN